MSVCSSENCDGEGCTRGKENIEGELQGIEERSGYIL